MKIVSELFEIRKLINFEKAQNKKIGLVPTMGCLHEGHLSLIDKANNFSDIVVVTIFVNPTQFNNKEDFIKYPRNIENDLRKLENKKVDYVFIPKAEEIYPEASLIDVSIKNLSESLCGIDRVGHFNGVCLVLIKFFNVISPDFAVFGEKDFQQLLIVKRLVFDLCFPIKIISQETFRCKSGLAMSSRNERLNDKQLEIAAGIYQILNNIRNKIEDDNGINIINLLSDSKIELLRLGFDKVDYLEIRDEKNLNLITNYDLNIKSRVFFAGYIENVRLIDNLKLY